MRECCLADLDRRARDLPRTERFADRLGDAEPGQSEPEPQASEPVSLGEGAQDREPDFRQRRRKAPLRPFEIGERFIDNHQWMTFLFPEMRENAFRL